MTQAAQLAQYGSNNVGLSFKNRIINGDMAINQRGVTSGVTSGYFVDRWALSGCSTSSVLTSSLPTGFTTGISISATSGNPIAIQKIESKNCSDLSGQSVTLSFYAQSISNATTLYASLAYANSADNFGATTTISEQNLGTLTGSWVKYTYTWNNLPSGALNGLAVNILCAGTSTFTMGITGVQLEKGSVATSFDYLPYGTELQLCQRYAWKYGGATGDQYLAGTGAYFDNNVIYFGPIQHPVPMRASVSMTTYGTPLPKLNGSPITGFALAVGIASNQGTWVEATKASHGVTNSLVLNLNTNTTSDYFIFSAEL
jgi:hypothetical protein